MLVNTSRGEVADESALAQAVETGTLSGIALDVYAQEPPKASPVLKLGDRAVLTPHLGASTREAQKRVSMELAEAVADFFERGLIRGGVNLPAGLDAATLERLGPRLILAERLGRFAGQALTGAWSRVELATAKAFAEKEQKALLQAALRGVLSCALGDKVTIVNAGVYSKERGLEARTAYLETAGIEEMSLTVAAQDSSRASVSGRAEADGSLRIVRIGELFVDVTPEGTLLVMENQDRPGMIGKVGTLLGKKGINIADMRVGRRSKHGKAIMVLTVDDKIPPSIMTALGRVDGITRVSLIQL
jgi:D-3-phosphoglycerate dehydrogenase